MFYTNSLFKDNKIYFKGYENDGSPIVGSRSYSPYVFIETDEETDFKAFYNSRQNLEKKFFETTDELKEYTSNSRNSSHGIGFSKNDVDRNDFAYQFITETFREDIDYHQEIIKILFIDIETESDEFPKVDNPTQKILAITASIRNGSKSVYTTFGIQPYDNFSENHPDKTYVYCESEKDMLKNFFEFVKEESPDIYSGYNSNAFDWAYIIARTQEKYNKEWLKKLSPFNLSPRKYQKASKFMGGSKITCFQIYGVAMIDWMEAYRKFTYVTRESYSLNNISHIELDEKKLDYSEYKNLHDLYKNNWKKFCDYNIHDVVLLDKLEDKLKLLELIIRVAYISKVNFEDVFSPVKVWDIMIYNYLFDSGIAAPMRVVTSKDRTNIGGRVKDPKIGFCESVVTFDATSLYPSVMLSLNISPETFLGKVEFNEKDILNKKFNNSHIKEKYYCIASNGALFDKTRKGIIVDLIQKLFDERTSFKELMFKLENENGDSNLIKKYNVFQEAIKILMNSLYGSMCNEYFRYYNLDIAEAITQTGQTIVQTAELSINKYVNKILETSDIDYTVFSDTDSCAIEMKDIIKKYNVPDNNINNFLDKVSKERIDPLLKDVFDEFADYLNFFQNKIYFKREMIVKKGFVVAKKKYAMNVLSKEKIIYDNPKLIVKGLEIVRSSTPEIVREYLKDVVKMVLETDEIETQKFIKGFKEKFFASDVVDVSFPRGVSDLGKFVFRDAFIKGTPIHVRASLNYNSLIDSKKLQEKYEYIKNGDKIKFLYLKLPNPTKQNVIAFKDYFPEELDYLKEYIDYETQFQKTFVSPLESIFESIGWEVEKKMTFADFF